MRAAVLGATGFVGRALVPALALGGLDDGRTDVITYGAMVQRIARLREKRLLIVTVPVLSPRLSSYWLHS